MNYYISSNELYHHGVLGMRWGIRRYQSYPDGKEGRFIGKKSRGASWRERRAKKKMIQKQSEILKNARAVKDEKEAREKKLEEVKKRPTATDVLEFADILSTQELTDLNNRINVIRNLEVTAKREKDKTFNQVDDAMGKVSKVKNWGKTSIDTYKMLNDIVDILNGTYGKKDSRRSRNQDREQNNQ